MTAFGWAILGAGAVSSHFVSGLRNSAFDARAVTVASRTRANAERFAGSFGVPHVSESYEAACASPGVDAVYVATPPSAHEAHALAAMWTRFLPLTRYMKRMIDSSAIGEIRAFTGSFSTAVRPGSRTGIFEAGSGGGALTYRGVYPLSLACLVMGPVTEAHTVAVFGDAGVDEDTIVARAATGPASRRSRPACGRTRRTTSGSWGRPARSTWRPRSTDLSGCAARRCGPAGRRGRTKPASAGSGKAGSRKG